MLALIVLVKLLAQFRACSVNGEVMHAVGDAVVIRPGQLLLQRIIHFDGQQFIVPGQLRQMLLRLLTDPGKVADQKDLRTRMGNPAQMTQCPGQAEAQVCAGDGGQLQLAVHLLGLVKPVHQGFA